MRGVYEHVLVKSGGLRRDEKHTGTRKEEEEEEEEGEESTLCSML